MLVVISFMPSYGLLGGYLSTNMGIFTFVIHTACYCMDTTHLNGNVWIKCLYAQVRR